MDAPAVQFAVAKAESLADTAELLACRAAAEVDEAARRNEFPGYLARTRTRTDTARAIASAKEAIRELVSVHADWVFAEGSPLPRIWRDSEAASRLRQPTRNRGRGRRARAFLAESPR